MGIARLTVPNVELGADHGLAGGADDQGEYENKPYLVAYGDRGDFINQLAGTTAVSGGAGGRITYQLPYQLPDNPRLYYRTCTWVPEGELIAGTSPIQYSHSVILATFRQPTFNYQGGDDPQNFNSLSQDPEENSALLYASQELDFAKEWMTIPNSAVKFKSDNTPINTSQGIGVVVQTIVITFHQAPILPFTLFKNFAGTLNNRTFLGCPKGTVYFEGPKTSREANTDGTATQRLQLTFKWRPIDWNMSIKQDGITWDYVVSKDYNLGPNGNSDIKCRYFYTNFLNLLQLTTG